MGLRQADDARGLQVTGLFDTGTAETHLEYDRVHQHLEYDCLGRWEHRLVGPFEIGTLKCRVALDVDYGAGALGSTVLNPVYLCQGLVDALFASEGEVFDGLFGVDLLTAPNGGGVEVLLDGRTRTTRVVAVHAGA